MGVLRFLGGAISALGLALGAVMALGPPDSARPVRAADAGVAGVSDAGAAGVVDDLRAAIHAGDIARVSAIFADHLAPAPDERAMQAALFDPMAEQHPKVDAFTRDWLAANPDSPLAQTARANFLFSMAQQWRGSAFARDVAPDAMQAFQRARDEARTLLLAAVKADPRLLFASDGLILTSMSIGQPRAAEAILAEVNRIMALVPNRAALVLAARALAPKWGGRLVLIKGLCDLHAARVPDQPGYDAAVCWIEGRLAADLPEGAERDRALADLAASDSPLLDYWRPGRPLVAGDTPADRLAALRALAGERPLTIDEARLHDDDATRLAVLTGETIAPAYPAAVGHALAAARQRVENAPGNWTRLQDYLHLAAQSRALGGQAPDVAEVAVRLNAHLAMAPYTADAWRLLGEQRLRDEGAGDVLDRHAEAEPYLTNAIVYAGAGTQALTVAALSKLSVYRDAIASGQPAADPARFQGVIVCPMVRQIRLLLDQCAATGQPLRDCTGGVPLDEGTLQQVVAEIRGAGLCTPEAAPPPGALRYAPVAVAPLP